MSDATNLTPEQLAELRAEARIQAGPFVDPRALRRVGGASFHNEWATAIIGRPFPGVRWLHNWEIFLIDRALDAEPNRPVPAAVAEREELARRELEEAERARQKLVQDEMDTWRALRDRLPIRVTVGHNFTIGHWESGYVTGRDHIVAQEDLHVGRLRRGAKQVFCETPSKKMSGRRNKDPLRGVDRDDGVYAKDPHADTRIPTCKPCLRVAERIAKPAPDLAG